MQCFKEQPKNYKNRFLVKTHSGDFKYLLKLCNVCVQFIYIYPYLCVSMKVVVEV